MIQYTIKQDCAGTTLMADSQQDTTMSTDRLLEALNSLNQISTTINRIGPNISTSIKDTLRLIVDSAIKVIPGTSAVIYIYEQDALETGSRVAAGNQMTTVPWDQPRPDGLGHRAVTERRRIISYEETIEIHPIKVAAGAQAAACYPLIVADQLVGVLYVYLHDTRQFNPFELSMLDNFVNQAAMAIYHARRVTIVRRDLLRKEEELARLHRAGLLISSRPRLSDTLDSILQMALDMTNARYGIFRIVDKSGDKLYTAAVAGEDLSEPLLEDLQIDAASVMTWVAQHRRPLLIPDLTVEPWASIYYPLDSTLAMRSELAVPLIGSSGRLEGILNLESPEVGAFTQADSHLLQALATQAVVAIQEVRLLDALQEVAKLLLTLPYQAVLVHLAKLACELVNAADTAIWLVEDGWLSLQAANRYGVHDKRIPLQGSLVGRAIIEQKPVVSNSVRTDPTFYRRDLAESQGWARALVVPLLASDDQEPIGALSVYSVDSDPGTFAESEWDTKVLITLAHYVSLAVHNETHQKALRAAHEQRTVAETFAAFGDVAANVLHQLNNKVGTIPVRVQSIQDKCAAILHAEPYLATNLSEIENSASMAMNSVRESLSLLHPLQHMPTSIGACVADAIAMVEPAETVLIHSHDLDALPEIAGKQSLTLVFANLIDNAVNAMEAKGTITIRGNAKDDWLYIALSDTGPGIPAELQNGIFEFSFSHQTTNHKSKLGFGLWWVKTLMARLGGSVTVDSDGHNGTTFWLKLPLPHNN